MTANSTVFKRPPLNDESLLIPAILVNHAKDNPAHPLFRYAAESEGTLRSIPWADAVCAFHRVAQIARQHVADHAGKRPVVAILGSFDHITYFSLVAGMLRVGYPVFPISPRNSKPAILHLLQSVDCAHVFTSADSATQAMADELVSTIAAQGGDLKRIPTPTFEDLYKTSGILEFIPLPQPKLDDVAIVMHSSGSVAFPKVIKITHRSLKHGGRWLDYGEVDLCGHVWSAHTMPTFHFCGVMQFVWAAFTGITLAVFPPVFPPVVPTPARIFDDAIATKASVLCCVPSFLERFKNVVFAGGPLQASAGDFLVRNRVNVAHLYGLTETGGLNLMMPANAPQEGWDWFHLSTHIDPVLVPVVDSPGVYRLIVKICATHTPAVFNTTVDGVSAFDTNDLLIRHPQNRKLWKVYGRQDDQIMHSNGEKTNPGPLEAIILKNPRIKHALMFGRGKFNAGIILFPTEPFSPADTERVLDFLEAIWPVVQEANQLAPSHSRIFKDMILVADPSKAVELTAKGTLRREPTLQIYQDEIRELYANVGKSSRTRITFPEKFDVPSSLRFARRVVTEVMLVAPGDDEDIFQHDCDSLQATWILNTILHALRASNLVKITTLPDDFVYSHPTIRLIAESLTAVASGRVSLLPDLSRRAATMEDTVLKYAREFPAHRPSAELPDQETVLITGTTGALGSHTLAFLLTLPEISTVYALNRPGANVVERQHASFAKHGIDAEFVSSPKLRILESDLTKPDFGISPDDFMEIRKRVTCIIHNAWQVDFKMSLASMEPCIQGTRNLVGFALQSPHSQPPRFIFVSTAGVFGNSYNEPTAPEARLPYAIEAARLGYAESKWVTEQILEITAQTTGLKPVIVRPGQLSGGPGGAWKTSEWFPTLLRSSQLLGHLPAIPGLISWVPIHHAGQILGEMRLSEKRYLHLTHPQPVPLVDVLVTVARDLDLPLVPYSDWLKSLEMVGAEGSENPGTALLDFFRANREVSAAGEAFFPAPFSNANAREVSGLMSSLEALGDEDVKQWVAYLRKVRFISQ